MVGILFIIMLILSALAIRHNRKLQMIWRQFRYNHIVAEGYQNKKGFHYGRPHQKRR